MEVKKIVILGPGGTVGSAITTELLKDGTRFKIAAVTRQTSKYVAPPNSDIIHTKIDYASFDSLVDVFTGQDAVVNCITGASTQYEPSKFIIDAAIAAGIKLYFANEFVGDVTREQFRRLPEALAGGKFRTREYLDMLGKEGKISWTSLNGGPFFDMWIAKGPAGFDLANRRARIYGTGENQLFWTPLPTIALAAANMLRNPQPIINRAIHICPFHDLKQNVILSALEEVLDTRFTVDHIDVQKINKNARIALDRGEGAKAMKGLAVSNQFYEDDSGNNLSQMLDNKIVGIEPISIKDAVKDLVERFGEDCQAVESLFKVEACEI
ncbi:hypothetical protein GQ44DRAFT_658889 [Phaeosphaeriaceae sp. PMI808]|nr:hypothetical protein GQ44DRAFT_658889 [Phaeosphaeriaceae sp. PMI808]